MIEPLSEPALESAAADATENRFREILPHLSSGQVQSLLDSLSKLPAEIVSNPQTGLIMLTAKDGGGEQFYLGEVLVTTAEVKVNKSQGHATVMGDDRHKAILAATLSAACRDNATKDTLSLFKQTLGEYATEVAHMHQQERAITASTRVKFESMAEEDPC